MYLSHVPNPLLPSEPPSFHLRMNTLLPELVGRIASFVSDPEDLKRARLSCKVLSRCMRVSNTPLTAMEGDGAAAAMVTGVRLENCDEFKRLFTPLQVRGLTLLNTTVREVLDSLGAEYCSALRTLIVVRDPATNYTAASPFSFSERPFQLDALRYLAVENVVFGGELRFSSLETFILKGERNSFVADDIPRFHMPIVGRVSVDGMSGTLFYMAHTPQGSVPSVRSLTIKSGGIHCLTRFPNVEQLHLVRCTGVSAVENQPLVNHRIRDLTLTDISSTQSSPIGPNKLIGGAFPSLTRLDLLGTRLPSIDLKALGELLPSLQSFSVFIDDVNGQLRLQHLPLSLTEFTGKAFAIEAGNSQSNLFATRARVKLISYLSLFNPAFHKIAAQLANMDSVVSGERDLSYQARTDDGGMVQTIELASF